MTSWPARAWDARSAEMAAPASMDFSRNFMKLPPGIGFRPYGLLALPKTPSV
jgi:hypothetical protein